MTTPEQERAEIRAAERETDAALERWQLANAKLSRLKRIHAYHDQQRALGHSAPRVPDAK